jgi:hypothetical protein
MLERAYYKNQKSVSEYQRWLTNKYDDSMFYEYSSGATQYIWDWVDTVAMSWYEDTRRARDEMNEFISRYKLKKLLK